MLKNSNWKWLPSVLQPWDWRFLTAVDKNKSSISGAFNRIIPSSSEDWNLGSCCGIVDVLRTFHPCWFSHSRAAYKQTLWWDCFVNYFYKVLTVFYHVVLRKDRLDILIVCCEVGSLKHLWVILQLWYISVSLPFGLH